MTPRRIQRKREKGWKMPPNTVYVGRGSKWGNQFMVGQETVTPDGLKWAPRYAWQAVGFFEMYLTDEIKETAKRELRGKNLACWCKEDEPFCHADVLLKLANEEDDHA